MSERDRRASGRSIILAIALCAAIVSIIAACSGIAAGSPPTATPWAQTPSTTPRAGGPTAGPLSGIAPAWALRLPQTVPGPRLTSAQTAGLTSMPWRLVALTNGGIDLDIAYVAGDGDCVTPAGFRVKATTASVEVWMLSKTAPFRTACADPLVLGRSTLQLTEPLGDRTLLHPPTDPAWSLNALSD